MPRKRLLQAMEVFVQVVRAEIEFYREERLAPVLAQEKEVLSAIDHSYNQIHYANSIVTGHLASIVKVHDAQENLLKEFGIEGLRKDIGQKLSSTSNSIAEFVKKAKRVDGTVEEMEEKIKKLTNKFDMLVGKQKKERGVEEKNRMREVNGRLKKGRREKSDGHRCLSARSLRNELKPTV